MAVVVVAVLFLGHSHGSGSPHGGAGVPRAGGTLTTSSTPDFPTSTAPTTPVQSSSAPSGSAPSTPVSRPVTPHASGPSATTISGSDGSTYRFTVYASDQITDCAAHAYGAPVISFLQSHPCHDAHRLLSTLVVNGRTAVLSVITVSFSPSAGDPDGYSAAGQLRTLENATGTGSMNDLLREGDSIPGVATAIPADEAFYVTGQDASLAIFDAWWVNGPTTDQDPTLINAESNLFLSPATPFD